MNQLRKLTVKDRLIAVSMLITIGGIMLSALLAEPRAFGLDALFVIGLLIAGWLVTRSPRLTWLLIFGLVVSLAELWAEWVQVDHLYLRRLHVRHGHHGHPFLPSRGLETSHPGRHLCRRGHHVLRRVLVFACRLRPAVPGPPGHLYLSLQPW
jgi:hypothetical protein